MPGANAFFQCVGEALAAKGLRALAGLVPFGEHIYDIAADVFQRWRNVQRVEEIHQSLRQELEEAAQANQQQFEQRMQAIAARVAPHEPPQVQKALTGYLSLIPARLRQTFCAGMTPAAPPSHPRSRCSGPRTSC